MGGSRNDLSWFKKWSQVLDWNRPYATWFKDGKLNASYNCLDVHLEHNSQKTAIIWESESGNVKKISYQELHEQVCQLGKPIKMIIGLKKVIVSPFTCQ